MALFTKLFECDTVEHQKIINFLLGGREALFQTGPGHPWLLETYARSAKYPFTTVVAQELFQAGIVPSDTDFHVFRKYGGLHGKNISYVENKHVMRFERICSVLKISIS